MCLEEGWIPEEKLDKLIQLFEEGKINKKELVESIYAEYETVRGVQPDIKGIMNDIGPLDTKHTILSLRVSIIFERGEIEKNPGNEFFVPNIKCADEKRLERQSKKLY